MSMVTPLWIVNQCTNSGQRPLSFHPYQVDARVVYRLGPGIESSSVIGGTSTFGEGDSKDDCGGRCTVVKVVVKVVLNCIKLWWIWEVKESKKRVCCLRGYVYVFVTCERKHICNYWPDYRWGHWKTFGEKKSSLKPILSFSVLWWDKVIIGKEYINFRERKTARTFGFWSSPVVVPT